MWVHYRMKILDLIEDKLFKMRELAELAKTPNLNSLETEALNVKLKKLARQVHALDTVSIKTEKERILK